MSKAQSKKPASPDDATTLRVDLANLTPLARDFIATSIALFTDPAPTMQFHRRQIERGRMALTIESGEVTWVNGPVPIENQ